MTKIHSDNRYIRNKFHTFCQSFLFDEWSSPKQLSFCPQGWNCKVMFVSHVRYQPSQVGPKSPTVLPFSGNTLTAWWQWMGSTLQCSHLSFRIDQEKAFDQVSHRYLHHVLGLSGTWPVFPDRITVPLQVCGQQGPGRWLPH